MTRKIKILKIHGTNDSKNSTQSKAMKIFVIPNRYCQKAIQTPLSAIETCAQANQFNLVSCVIQQMQTVCIARLGQQLARFDVCNAKAPASSCAKILTSIETGGALTPHLVRFNNHKCQNLENPRFYWIMKILFCCFG